MAKDDPKIIDGFSIPAGGRKNPTVNEKYAA
jgi:hypothetical protein